MESFIKANKQLHSDTRHKLSENIYKEIEINKKRELTAMRKKFTKKLEILKDNEKIDESIIDSLNEFFLEELETYDSAITADTRTIIEDHLITYDNKSHLLYMNAFRLKNQQVEEELCNIINAPYDKKRSNSISSESASSNTSEDIDFNAFIGRFNLSDNIGFATSSIFNFNSEDDDDNDNGITHCNSDNDSDTEISMISTEQQLNLRNVIDIRSICSKNGVNVSQSGRKKSKAELISELLSLENISL
jgi:hypothetical protein